MQNFSHLLVWLGCKGDVTFATIGVLASRLLEKPKPSRHLRALDFQKFLCMWHLTHQCSLASCSDSTVYPRRVAESSASLLFQDTRLTSQLLTDRHSKRRIVNRMLLHFRVPKLTSDLHMPLGTCRFSVWSGGRGHQSYRRGLPDPASSSKQLRVRISWQTSAPAFQAQGGCIAQGCFRPRKWPARSGDKSRMVVEIVLTFWSLIPLLGFFLASWGTGLPGFRSLASGVQALPSQTSTWTLASLVGMWPGLCQLLQKRLGGFLGSANC